MAITQRDRQEWFHSPVTQDLLKGLTVDRQAILEEWAHQAFVSDSRDITLHVNAAALGSVKMLDSVIEVIDSYGKGDEE